VKGEVVEEDGAQDGALGVNARGKSAIKGVFGGSHCERFASCQNIA
jgi:hypothetical protein